MKKSIAYLPPVNQVDLNFLVTEIIKRLKQTEMIILFGSYARNKFVVYDEKFEFGKVQFYVSDYDILVVTDGIPDAKASRYLDNVDEVYYNRAKDPDRQPPVQIVNIDIKDLTKALSDGHYFYSQIKQEGVMLYNSEKFKLPRRRKLNFEEIKQQAQEYFNEKFESGNEFLLGAKFYYEQKLYKKASFLLHQACENYFYAIRLVYTQQNNKQHNLSKLLGSVKKYSTEFVHIFPQHTAEEKRLFNLIKAAYVDGRFNPKFEVTKEDIDALIPKVEMLRDLTKEICEKKIMEYGEEK